MTDEKEIEEVDAPMPCKTCGRTDLPLFTDYQCPECHKVDDLAYLPDKCNGCLRANWTTNTCLVYGNPRAQHRRPGGCAMRTHDKKIKTEDGKFIDPLKASKRAAKGVR